MYSSGFPEKQNQLCGCVCVCRHRHGIYFKKLARATMEAGGQAGDSGAS